MKSFTTDEVFDVIGHLGRGHVLYMGIVSTLTFFVASHMVLNIFAGLEPHFTCIPFSLLETAKKNNDTRYPLLPLSASSSNSFSFSPTVNSTLGSLQSSQPAVDIPSISFHASVKRKGDTEEHSLLEPFREFQRSFNTGPLVTNNSDAGSRTVRSAPLQRGETAEDVGAAAPNVHKMNVFRDQCPDNDPAQCRLAYDETFLSIVQEWGLVCSAKQRVAAVQAAWMTGVMAGALLLARLPDMYGRSSTLLMATLGTVAFEGLSSFTDSFTIYVVLRLLGGTMCAIVILSSFVLSQELVGASKRSLVGVICSSAFSIGIALLAVVATTTNNWRTLTLMVSVAGVPCAGLLLLLPESPRWLASKGRLEEAAQSLQRIARLNGRASALPQKWRLLPPGAGEDGRLKDELFDDDGGPRPESWLGHRNKQVKNKRIKKVLQKLDEKNTSVLEMLRHGYIVRLLVILLYSWFVNSAVFYGLTLAASDLAGNVYLSTALNGLVELPSNLIVLLVVDRLGRRSTLVGFMVCGGVSCLLVPLLDPLNPAYTVLALLGKLCISASFTVAYIHSGEIFPTCIRNTGIGLLSVSARTGGIVCPFILMLSDVAPGLHFAVLGLLALTSGLLNITLPETLGRPTPETVDHMLAFREGRKVSDGSGYSRLRHAEDGDDSSSVPYDGVMELDNTDRNSAASYQGLLVE